MDTNEKQIETLVRRWAHAVHVGDMAGVLADHAQDIVMFDVPPPQRGVRGIAAYEETWSPFFGWQAQGALFDIVELDVTAGDDVAFAIALLRCGMPEDIGEQRMRLTIGLTKTGGRWTVTHEHHSFPDETPDRSADKDALREIHRQWFAETSAKDLDGLMSHIATDIVSYEHDAPLEHVGLDQVRAVCKAGLDSSSGVGWDVPDMQLVVDGDLAVAWGLNRMQARPDDGEQVESWSRGTRVFRRRDGRWSMVHQHVSYPYDPHTGDARTDLRPTADR